MKLMQDMTPEELELVEVDKARWLQAHKMYTKWGRKQLTDWLNTHEDVELREDIRRRLNIMRTNKKGN